MRKEILDHLLSPTEIEIPNYLENTITEEVKNSGLSHSEIEVGLSRLRFLYSNLKKRLPRLPDYSDSKQYIAYIMNYLRDYYPRMIFIMNHLLRYTNFFDLLISWSGETINILDIGAGPGTMFFAFIEYITYLNQLEIFDFNYDVNIIEVEGKFLNFIDKVLENISTFNPIISEKLSMTEPIKPFFIDFDNLEKCLNPILSGKQYKVIILSFILNENQPNKQKNKDLFKLLSNHLEENGIIIFIGAASDYLHEYFEIDFEEEMDLIRIAPCLNGNRVYSKGPTKREPFFCPCGDLCVYQLSSDERNKFCFLVLSKKDILKKDFEADIQKSINFFQKNIKHLYMGFKEKVKELGERFNIIGIFTNKEKLYRSCNYYFCNGGCKFKIDGLEYPELEIQEGDLVIFRNLIYDGEYIKRNTKTKPVIVKHYGEIGCKYNRDPSGGIQSSYEIIPYCLP